MYRNPDTCLGNTSSMLCALAGTDVGLFTLHMPLLSLCTTPAILVQSAVPGFPTGLPMGLPASPGGTPVSGYITHHVEGSALFTCVSCQESCHCSHFPSCSCSVRHNHCSATCTMCSCLHSTALTCIINCSQGHNLKARALRKCPEQLLGCEPAVY